MRINLALGPLCLMIVFVTGLLAIAQDAQVPRRDPRGPFPGLQPDRRVLLPNGWSLSPQGKQIAMGDFPVNIQLAPDGQFAAILHCGYGEHEIRIVSLDSQAVVSTTHVDQAFYGMTFCNNGKALAVSGAEDEQVYVFPYADGYLGKPTIVRVGKRESKFVVAGVSALDQSQELAVCGLLAHQWKVLKRDSGEVRLTVDLGADTYPYASVIDEEHAVAYVSLWGKAAVAVVDLKTGKLQKTWATPSHPTEMSLLDEGRVLLVACSNENSVAVVDTQAGRTLEIIRTSLYPTAKNGSTPGSLCVSPNGKVMLVANSDNNNLAVFDISDRGHSTSLGFIPVGWYPTSVRFDGTGEAILVANGKGLTSRSNIYGGNPNIQAPDTVREYIGSLFKGTLSIIDNPSPADMARMTRLAMKCSPLASENLPNTPATAANNPIPKLVGQPSPIKHCIYIVKENRTYDQVFGDMDIGNGDPSLCIFPENVTPNQHALARQYVLLDNFYVESEVSADGHEWSMAAYATDFVEKTWPLTYRGGRGKLTYPAEGKVKIAEPSSGYIWDQCRKHNVSYFSFGEFVENGKKPTDPSTTKIEALQGHFDTQYRSYDLDYPDVKRAERFVQRWQQFEREGNTPQLTIVRLPNDHTYATRVGKPTPTAMVADNDLALGMLVEGVSRSAAWKETAIFVVEDDAQNGSDHVDAHRTVALVISPYTRGAGLDSTLYSTASMLRTMELILGMEPMTQFDAAATPLANAFRAQADTTPFKALPAQVDLTATNKATAWGAQRSEELDLTKEDAADDLLLGDIVWRSVRGAQSPMPAPVRAAFVFAAPEDEEEEEEEEREREEAEERAAKAATERAAERNTEGK